MIDLQKAFDTISNESLFKNLKAIAFCEGCITENQPSDYGRISCDVPPGSIRGLLLFLIYVNDILQAVFSNLFLYADNACLVFQHKGIEEIEKVWNNGFEKICDWFVDNKLSILFGKGKTKSILFTSQRKIKNIKKTFLFII